METAKEKAVNWLFDHTPGFDVFRHSDEIESLTILLKEQDRSTRHACAEAIMSIDDLRETPTENSVICPFEAHKACMNVKAV